MFEIPLHHPIHTLDGRELVPAGVALTEEVVRDVIVSNSRPAATHLPLMECGKFLYARPNDHFRCFSENVRQCRRLDSSEITQDGKTLTQGATEFLNVLQNFRDLSHIRPVSVEGYVPAVLFQIRLMEVLVGTCDGYHGAPPREGLVAESHLLRLSGGLVKEMKSELPGGSPESCSIMPRFRLQ